MEGVIEASSLAREERLKKVAIQAFGGVDRSKAKKPSKTESAQEKAKKLQLAQELFLKVVATTKPVNMQEFDRIGAPKLLRVGATRDFQRRLQTKSQANRSKKVSDQLLLARKEWKEKDKVEILRIVAEAEQDMEMLRTKKVSALDGREAH